MNTIGTKIQATLWHVEYRHLCDEKRKHDAQPGEHFTGGSARVLTADPSGEDLCRVAREAVLGTCGPSRDFSLVSVKRVADAVKGLALRSDPDMQPSGTQRAEGWEGT